MRRKSVLLYSAIHTRATIGSMTLGTVVNMAKKGVIGSKATWSQNGYVRLITDGIWHRKTGIIVWKIVFPCVYPITAASNLSPSRTTDL